MVEIRTSTTESPGVHATKRDFLLNTDELTGKAHVQLLRINVN